MIGFKKARITTDQALVECLSGVIKLPNDYKLNDDYGDYLNEKYE